MCADENANDGKGVETWSSRHTGIDVKVVGIDLEQDKDSLCIARQKAWVRAGHTQRSCTGNTSEKEDARCQEDTASDVVVEEEEEEERGIASASSAWVSHEGAS